MRLVTQNSSGSQSPRTGIHRPSKQPKILPSGICEAASIDRFIGSEPSSLRYTIFKKIRSLKRGLSYGTRTMSLKSPELTQKLVKLVKGECSRPYESAVRI